MTGQAYVAMQDLLAIRSRLKVWRDLPNRNLFEHFAGQQPTPQRGRGLDFEELRHYQQGDDIRRIDWRVSQRSGAPHVRVYSEESDRTTMVMLDQRMGMFFGSRYDTKSSAAAKIAALIGWRDVQCGDRFGLHVFNEEEQLWLKPSRRQNHLLQCMQAIVDFNTRLRADKVVPAHARTLRDQLQMAIGAGVADQRIILISDLSGWCEESPGLLRLLNQHHDVLVVLTFDPLERNLALAKGNVFGDHAYQLQVDEQHIQSSSSDGHRKNIDVLDNLGIPCVSLDASRDGVEDVLRYFARLRYGR